MKMICQNCSGRHEIPIAASGQDYDECHICNRWDSINPVANQERELPVNPPSYTVHDFLYTLERLGLRCPTIEVVHFAWGYSPEGYASWTGGFVIETIEGVKILTGWCDTTGWGCQDGAFVYDVDKADMPSVQGVLAREEKGYREVRSWDHHPPDLNRVIREGKKEHDDVDVW